MASGQADPQHDEDVYERGETAGYRRGIQRMTEFMETKETKRGRWECPGAAESARRYVDSRPKTQGEGRQAEEAYLQGWHDCLQAVREDLDSLPGVLSRAVGDTWEKLSVTLHLARLCAGREKE